MLIENCSTICTICLRGRPHCHKCLELIAISAECDSTRLCLNQSEPIWTNLDQSEPAWIAWSLREFRTDSCDSCEVKSDIGFDHMHNHGPADDLRSNVAIGVRRTWRAVAWAQIFCRHQALTKLRENDQGIWSMYEWCTNRVRTVSGTCPSYQFCAQILCCTCVCVRDCPSICSALQHCGIEFLPRCYLMLLCYLLHHLQ